uniref:Lymphocyte cytosolic protein 2 n=1 Tax=Malurus cyaneus samueli TaxID=2593467 RepID=A0A8C5UCM4_9PASS
MDLRNIPYRSDVLSWSPDDLADYFRTVSLNMSENDIQKFPKLRVPCFAATRKLLWRVWCSVPAPTFMLLYQDDDDDDDDYESPDEDQEKEDEADYESPTEDPEEGEHDSDGYEPPPSNNDEAHHSVIFPAKSLPSSTDYIDLSFLLFVSTAAPHRPVPQLSLPPYSSNAFPPKSLKPPPKPGSNTIPGAERFVSPLLVLLLNISLLGSLKDEWYVAYISRPEAEAALRKINKDGTFLVRDSSRKTVTHPYVLMVLYRDKVYNIQIRYQEQDHLYLLGTGLKGKEDFSSVADIIDHFQRTPLLLIDGKDRGSRNQCMLKYAAGHI